PVDHIHPDTGQASVPVLIVTILQKDKHGGQDNPEEGLSLHCHSTIIGLFQQTRVAPVRTGNDGRNAHFRIWRD
ncbi:MAG: hypothetical protein J4F48_08125, partial [Nitrospinae bacterium]|nr:hypothetical protein [Nitrospinota bacterium]